MGTAAHLQRLVKRLQLEPLQGPCAARVPVRAARQLSPGLGPATTPVQASALTVLSLNQAPPARPLLLISCFDGNTATLCASINTNDQWQTEVVKMTIAYPCAEGWSSFRLDVPGCAQRGPLPGHAGVMHLVHKRQPAPAYARAPRCPPQDPTQPPPPGPLRPPQGQQLAQPVRHQKC